MTNYFVRFLGNLVDDFSGSCQRSCIKEAKDNLLSERGA
jgi:hypothetical protein